MLMAFSIVFILAIVEVILGTTHLFRARKSWSEPDPLMGYRFTPNKKYWCFAENDHPITGKINRYGWRDKDWLEEKGGNEIRIAVLGDSFVVAFEVEEEKTFLSLAEDILNQTEEKQYEFMNFGRTGYTQAEELLSLTRDILKFDPDMVVLFFGPRNDIRDISRETAPDKLRPFFSLGNNGELQLDTSFDESGQYKIKSLINTLKQHSTLISFICERFNYLRQKEKNQPEVVDALNGYLSLCTSSPLPAFGSNYELNKRLIEEMALACEENGIEFVLVSINLPTYFPEIENKYKEKDPSFDSRFFENDLRDYARKLGIHCFGLHSLFSDHYRLNKKALHWLGHWGHWNYSGHQVVADKLAEKIDEIISSGALSRQGSSAPR